MTETEDDQYDDEGELNAQHWDRLNKLSVDLGIEIDGPIQLTVLELIVNYTDEVDISEDSPNIEHFLMSTLVCLRHYPEHMPLTVRKWLILAVNRTMNDPANAKKHFHLYGKNKVDKKSHQKTIIIKTFKVVHQLSQHFKKHKEEGSFKSNPGAYFIAAEILHISPSTAESHYAHIASDEFSFVFFEDLIFDGIDTITQSKINQAIEGRL